MRKESMMKDSRKNDPVMNEVDAILGHLAIEMDKDFMRVGKTLAELYRAVCTAAAKLPDLELHTELMCVVNNDDKLTVIFHRDAVEAGMHGLDEEDDDEDDEDDEDEEVKLYDGD